MLARKMCLLCYTEIRLFRIFCFSNNNNNNNHDDLGMISLFCMVLFILNNKDGKYYVHTKAVTQLRVANHQIPLPKHKSRAYKYDFSGATCLIADSTYICKLW